MINVKERNEKKRYGVVKWRGKERSNACYQKTQPSREKNVPHDPPEHLSLKHSITNTETKNVTRKTSLSGTYG